MRALLDAEEDNPTLMNLLEHLVAVDHALLEKIARSEMRETDTALVTRLILHSYNHATSGRSRGEVRAVANVARLASFLPVAPGTGDLLLTDAQNAALERLEALLEIYFTQAGTPGPVRMRIAPLIVGASGCGKSFLAQILAKRHGLGLLRVSVSEWMVQGSKASEPTLDLIKRTIGANPQGLVLHVDEIDKLMGDEHWTVAQRGEIYCCAGDRVVTGSGWNEKLNLALRDRVYVIASGTWQTIWSQRLTRHIGFSKPDLSVANIEEEIRAAKVIPDELLFRWGPIVPLLPYTVKDFARMGEALGLTPDFLDPEEAARSHQNFRAIESALTRRALAHHRARRRVTLNHTAS